MIILRVDRRSKMMGAGQIFNFKITAPFVFVGDFGQMAFP
jgi:hypothetical protein